MCKYIAFQINFTIIYICHKAKATESHRNWFFCEENLQYSTVPNKRGVQIVGGWENFLRFNKRGGPTKRGLNWEIYILRWGITLRYLFDFTRIYLSHTEIS